MTNMASNGFLYGLFDDENDLLVYTMAMLIGGSDGSFSILDVNEEHIKVQIKSNLWFDEDGHQVVPVEINATLTPNQAEVFVLELSKFVNKLSEMPLKKEL